MNNFWRYSRKYRRKFSKKAENKISKRQGGRFSKAKKKAIFKKKRKDFHKTIFLYPPLQKKQKLRIKKQKNVRKATLQ